MSHTNFSHPMQLSKDYIPLEDRTTPKIKKPVRTRQERMAFAEEIGVGRYFFAPQRRETRVRMMELLGKGDVRLGYARLLDEYKKVEVRYKKMFRELIDSRDSANFAVYIKRHRQFVTSTEQAMEKAGGICTYTAMKSARSILKKYKLYKELP